MNKIIYCLFNDYVNDSFNDAEKTANHSEKTAAHSAKAANHSGAAVHGRRHCMNCGNFVEVLCLARGGGVS